MKNASIFSTVLLLLAVFFTCQTAQAQWSQNTTSIYPTTLTKKVGIGMNNPSYIFHVNGKSGAKATSLTNFTTGGVLELLSTDKNFTLNLDGDKLQATKTSSTFLVTANSLLLNPFGGNVGIGTSAPAEAKFVVQGAVGNTVAQFRKNSTSRGLSIVTDWPGIYFNTYYNAGSKSMAAGFAGIVNFDPDFGRFDFGITGTSASAANVAVDPTTRMCITKDGNVGIGTGAPASRLDIVAQDGLRVQGYEPFITIQDNNSSKMARIQSAHGDIAFFKMTVGQTVATPQMVIKDNGNVLIGTINDFGYKLAVNGSLLAKEIRVQTGWADYVFADEYQLRPLEEVESFIKANKHLPDILPAKEIQENGLLVAETTTKMMAKIEELTLYLIELKKENDCLKTRIENLEKN